jgi:hypothetical protein
MSNAVILQVTRRENLCMKFAKKPKRKRNSRPGSRPPTIGKTQDKAKPNTVKYCLRIPDSRRANSVS